jgi:uncharacterized protein
MQMRRQVLIGTAAAGAGVLGYASVIERNWFVLRRYDVPVLSAGARPIRLLHISDIHLTPGRHRLLSFLRSLDALQPDLVVNTGDSIGHRDAIEPLMDALGPLLDRPGVFVYGSNDLYAPKPRNPARYLLRDSAVRVRYEPDLPWPELGAAMEAAGWMDANNRRGMIKAGDLNIAVAGVHDSHIDYDRYDDIAGPADPSADLRLGVLHSPEPSVMDRFADDGYELLLAGHTHGGQLCLPWYGSIVTNCGIDPERARGLHRHPADATDPNQPWLEVSAGLGTSPWAPFRFCCRPEASLLTLVPRIS